MWPSLLPRAALSRGQWAVLTETHQAHAGPCPTVVPVEHGSFFTRGPRRLPGESTSSGNQVYVTFPLGIKISSDRFRQGREPTVVGHRMEVVWAEITQSPRKLSWVATVPFHKV